MREDDVVRYCRYEAEVLRPTSNAAGIFDSSEDRYRKHQAAVAAHQPYYVMIEEARAAKRARRDARQPDEAPADNGEPQVPQDRPDEPVDDGGAHGDDGGDSDEEEAEGVDSATIKGDAPSSSWEDYLTFGVAITTARNDKFLELHSKYLDALKHGVGPDELRELAKVVGRHRRLITEMTKRKVKEAFRTLYDLKHKSLETLDTMLVGRCREMTTRSADTQLERWLVIHHVRIAAGWPGGVFESTTRVSELLQSRNADEWNAQESATERERTERVIKALKGVEIKGVKITCSAYSVSMRRLNGIVLLLQSPGTSTLGLSLKNIAAGDQPAEWAVTRTGELWEKLDTCPEPEWPAFFAKHWELGKGAYAPVDGVKPAPRI
jgi:hypothetical protein